MINPINCFSLKTVDVYVLKCDTDRMSLSQARIALERGAQAVIFDVSDVAIADAEVNLLKTLYSLRI